MIKLEDRLDEIGPDLMLCLERAISMLESLPGKNGKPHNEPLSFIAVVLLAIYLHGQGGGAFDCLKSKRQRNETVGC